MTTDLLAEARKYERLAANNLDAQITYLQAAVDTLLMHLEAQAAPVATERRAYGCSCTPDPTLEEPLPKGEHPWNHADSCPIYARWTHAGYPERWPPASQETAPATWFEQTHTPIVLDCEHGHLVPVDLASLRRWWCDWCGCLLAETKEPRVYQVLRKPTYRPLRPATPQREG